LTGAKHPARDGAVTVTSSPILLESAEASGPTQER
jgi:hypothetical protein